MVHKEEEISMQEIEYVEKLLVREVNNTKKLGMKIDN